MNKRSTLITNIGQGVAVALLLGIIYLNVDMRDFMKFTQPSRDLKQDESMKVLRDRIDMCDSINMIKFNYVHLRVDDYKSDINEIKKSVNELKDDVNYIKKVLITNNNSLSLKK